MFTTIDQHICSEFLYHFTTIAELKKLVATSAQARVNFNKKFQLDVFLVVDMTGARDTHAKLYTSLCQSASTPSLVFRVQMPLWNCGAFEHRLESCLPPSQNWTGGTLIGLSIKASRVECASLGCLSLW